MKSRLHQRAEIHEVTVNPVTGSVLILHDEGWSLAEAIALLVQVISETAARADDGQEPWLALDWLSGDATRRYIRMVAMLASGVVGIAGIALASPMYTVAAGATALAVVVDQIRGRQLDGETGRGKAGAFVLRELRPHRDALLSAAAWGAGGITFSLVRFGLIGLAINTAVRGVATGAAGSSILWTIVSLGALTMLASAASSACEYAAQVKWRTVLNTFQHDLRMRVYDRLQTARLADLPKGSASQLVTVATEDINRLDGLFDSSWELYKIVLNGLGISALFVMVLPSFAMIPLIGIPSVLETLSIIQDKYGPRYRSVREAAAIVQAHMATNLAGLTTLKSIGAEGTELARLGELDRAYRTRSDESAKLASAFVPALEFSVMFGITLALIAGGVLARRGLSAGAYAALVMLTRQLLWPVAQMGLLIESGERSISSAERIMTALHIPTEDVSRGLPLNPERAHGDIVFADVGFAYEPGVDVLDGLSLVILAGRKTAIVGPTGVGKSTLVQLLLRFRDQQAGSVRLDGVDIAEFRLRDLRQSFAVVTQDIFLVEASIRDNISLGRADATCDEIVTAAMLAGCHGFITDLPAGYETNIGDRGAKLSGGQRQLLTIARAVLRRAPIIILDEATSQLDNETEARLFEGLTPFFAGRTAIVITHRLRAARLADRIYVMSGGRVIEAGCHNELVGANGAYAALWRMQAESPAASPDAPCDAPVGHMREGSPP